MSRLEFTPLAEQDLWQILEFIAKDSSVAGISFVERLRAKCELLAAQPLMGQARPEFAKGEYRCITFGHYVVYYRPLLDGVVIARVLHGARDHDALIDRASMSLLPSLQTRGKLRTRCEILTKSGQLLVSAVQVKHYVEGTHPLDATLSWPFPYAAMSHPPADRPASLPRHQEF